MNTQEYIDGRDKLQDGSFRAALLDYVEKEYKTKPDYPWERDSQSAVLRHADNRKWYGLVMKVAKSKLGLCKDGMIDVLNVKNDDRMFHDMLIGQDGYLPGYHMNKQSWITVFLDGTVPFEEVCGMLDASYKATASKKKKRKIRIPNSLSADLKK